MDPLPVQSGDSSVPVVPCSRAPTGDSSTSSTTNLPEADVQRIAQAVATILKETGAPLLFFFSGQLVW